MYVKRFISLFKYGDNAKMNIDSNMPTERELCLKTVKTK